MTTQAHRGESDVDTFYRDYWRSPAWGGAELNEDEVARATAILEMLRRTFRSAHGTVSPPEILDIGCGRGWLTAMLSRLGHARGIDPTGSSVARARELFPMVDFRQREVQELLDELGPCRFDCVVSSEVIEHVRDQQKPAFLRSIYTLLKKGGHALLTTPRGELWEWYKNTSPGLQPVEHWIGERELDHLAQLQLFQIVERSRIFVPGYPYCLPARLLGIRRLRRLSDPIRCAWPVRNLAARVGVYQILLLRRTQ